MQQKMMLSNTPSSKDMIHSGFEPSIGGEKCSNKMKPRANIYQVSRFYFAIEPKKRKGKFREIT